MTIAAIVAVITTVITAVIAITGYAIAIGATVMVDAIAALLRIAVATVCGGCLRAHGNEGECHNGGQQCILHESSSYPV